MISLFVLIDALGWTYVDDSQFLADLLGFRRPLKTVLGFSSGAIPAILTGLTPARSGAWNLFYYDPDNSPFRWLRNLRFLPDRILDCRLSGKILKELGRRVLHLGHGFDCCVPPHLLPWFNVGEKKNIYEAGGIPGVKSIIDDLARHGIRHRVYTYHRFTDAEVLREARRDLEAGAAEFYLLYLSEVDGFLHHNCQDPGKTREKLRWYERELRSLVEFARGLDADARVTVFSDHGMAPVRGRYDLMADVERLGLRMPEDYLAVYDSTMARFWLFSDRARKELPRALSACERGHVLSSGELAGLGLDFGDNRFGDIVFLLEAGSLIARSGFENPRWMPTGMHGYHPDDPYSDACFLSDHEPPVDVRTIMDLHQCMRQAAFTR